MPSNFQPYSPHLTPSAMDIKPVVLVLSGFDPSGGAGLLADVKACHANGAYACGVITAHTVQNTFGVSAVQAVSDALILRQLSALVEDLPIHSIKVGMLVQPAVIQWLHDYLTHNQQPLILDTPWISSNGYPLVEPAVQRLIVQQLFPLSQLLTPNQDEWHMLSTSVECEDSLSDSLKALQLRHLLLKGGHGQGSWLSDRWVSASGAQRQWLHPHLPSRNTHGTGCTLASSIAARLAQQTLSATVPNMAKAISQGIAYTQAALRGGMHQQWGQGKGSLDHWVGHENGY